MLMNLIANVIRIRKDLTELDCIKIQSILLLVLIASENTLYCLKLKSSPDLHDLFVSYGKQIDDSIMMLDNCFNHEPASNIHEVSEISFIILGIEQASITTQASLLGQKLAMPCLSMNQLLEQFVLDRSASKMRFRKRSLPFYASPLFLIKSRLQQIDTHQGWILTEYPTNFGEAEYFDGVLEHLGRSQPHVIYLDAPQPVLSDEDITFPGVQNLPEQQLQQSKRLLAPLIQYYREQERLTILDGNAATQDVHQHILQVANILLPSFTPSD